MLFTSRPLSLSAHKCKTCSLPAMTSGWLVPHASLELPSGTEMDNCIRDQCYASRDGIIESFDRGNAEGAALDRQTDQSKAEPRARTPLFGRGASVRRLAGKSLRLLSTTLVVLRN